MNTNQYVFSEYEQFKYEQSQRIKNEIIKKNKFELCETLDSIYDKISNGVLKIQISNLHCKINDFFIEIELIDILKDESGIVITPIFYDYSYSLTNENRLFYTIKCILIEKFYKIKEIQSFCFYNSKIEPLKVKTQQYRTEAQKVIDSIIKLKYLNSSPSFFHIKECNYCYYFDSCYNKLMEKDCISLLGGVNTKIVNSYNSKGFFTINQLSFNFRPKKNSKRYYPELKALAIRENKICFWEFPEIKIQETEIFLDIENLPDEKFVYLIGLIVRQYNSEEYFSFWLNSNADILSIFKEISTILNKANIQIFYYGNLESKFFSEYINSGFELDIKNTKNVLSIISDSIYFPTLTNSLKEICNYLGYFWEDNIKHGLKSIIVRKEWEKENNNIFKDNLIEYNKNDCKALMLLVDKIRKFKSNEEEIIDIGSLKKQSVFHWRKTDDYFEENLNEINKFSYFTYNRDKIHVRINKKLRKKLVKNKSYLKSKYQPNEIIEVYPEKCPNCKTQAKKYLRNRLTIVTRNVVDLKFINNGIKRWITQYKGGEIKCLKCGHIFSSQNVWYNKIYGANLKRYCVNQHISHHVSFNSIADSLSIFNIHLNKIRVFEFKREIAQNLSKFYEELKNNLLKSNLIQIDETEIKLKKKKKAYVWVFANFDTVYYLYRENRKANFLKEFLGNYSGIILSDFYSGYDSLNLPQQKCLVHLLRDLNSDFYHNQLDEELKLIVKKFGVLLKEIVKTIDKYGLRKRNLNKHIKQVEEFYNEIFGKDFNSEIANKYKKRFLKYKEKLFTFLKYNDIPWHNNNAEYAIKAFAKHREKGNRIFTEDSINDYMILLSIEQTCKYRGIKFMDFLLDSNVLK